MESYSSDVLRLYLAAADADMALVSFRSSSLFFARTIAVRSSLVPAPGCPRSSFDGPHDELPLRE